MFKTIYQQEKTPLLQNLLFFHRTLTGEKNNASYLEDRDMVWPFCGSDFRTDPEIIELLDGLPEVFL